MKNQKINDLEEKVNNLNKTKNKDENKENVGNNKNQKDNKNKKEEPVPKTKKDQKALEKSQNLTLDVMNNSLKEQNLIQQKKIEELTNKLDETEQSYIDKIRQLRQENNIRNMALLDKEDDKDLKNEDDMKGRELLINYCALLKDLTKIKGMLNVDEMNNIVDELDIIMRSYNIKQVKSLNIFKNKILTHLKDLNDVNKVHRLQRAKVVVNKYYQTLEAKVKNLL